MDNDNTIQKYDRIRGGLHDIALFTKPSTIQNVQALTGKSETFIVETARHAEVGDYIFVQCIDENGTVRLALPPKVANVIASHREALSVRRRSIAGRKNMAERIAAGHDPGKALREYRKRKKVK